MVLGLALAPAAYAADWQPGPDAILDNTYSGSIDAPSGGGTVSSTQPLTIAGWVLDRSADGWTGIDGVDVYDGVVGQGTFLGHALIDQSRPDVAQAFGNDFWANSGFVLNVDANTLGVGGHTVTVYAHTPGKGWWSSSVSFNIAAPSASAAPVASAAAPVNVIISPRGITIPRSQDRVTVKGYAFDPAATSNTPYLGIDHVEVYVEEPREVASAKHYVGIPQLGLTQSQASDKYGIAFYQAGWQIDMKLSNLDPGNHHIYAYAKSSITGQETMDSAGFNIGS